MISRRRVLEKRDCRSRRHTAQRLQDLHADRVVSIEMLEAVGKLLAGYFRTVSQCLRRRRRNHQVITVPDEEFAAYRKTVDFIQYIFPGGMLLCPEQMAQLQRRRVDTRRRIFVWHRLRPHTPTVAG